MTAKTPTPSATAPAGQVHTATPDLQSLDGQIAWCIANLHRLPLIGILTNLRLLAEQRAALKLVTP